MPSLGRTGAGAAPFDGDRLGEPPFGPAPPVSPMKSVWTRPLPPWWAEARVTRT